MPEAKDQAAFRARLEALRGRVGSYYRLAQLSGIREDKLAHYHRRGSDPSRAALVALARGAGVSIAWLAAGESDIRVELLAETIEMVERAQARAEVEIEPPAKARLIVHLYLESEASGAKPEPRRVLALVRATAA